MNRGNKAEYSGNEKWQKFKKEFWGKKLLATTEWGLIDFDPQGKDDMVGGDALSYDEYLDLQMQSGKRVRTYFEICYYDADFFSFKGRIKRINTKKQLLCFERIFVEASMETETVFPERKTMSGCRLLVLKTTASGIVSFLRQRSIDT